MAVKVIIARKLMEGNIKPAYNILNDLRRAALEQPGYISGETLIAHDDPQKMVVISTWQSRQNWLNWQDNPDRKALEGNLRRLLTEPPSTEMFVLGTYPAQH